MHYRASFTITGSQTSSFHFTTDCFSAALDRHGENFQERPILFFQRTSTFAISLLGVPGDEKVWNSLSGEYHWTGVAPTLAFVGILFQLASQHGFDADRSSTALIDVGANMGQEVVVAGLYNYKATTFEILPRSAKTVKFNLAANCVSLDLTTIVNSGAGEQSGSLMMDFSGFSAAKVAGSASDAATDKAHIWSLDDYFFEQDSQELASRPLLLKLDCEGCEPGALKGSQKLMRDYPPHFILLEYRSEYPGYTEEVAKLMLDLHYTRAFVVTNTDSFLVGKDQVSAKETFFKSDLRTKSWSVDDGPCLCDILFVHNDAIDIGLF